MKHVGKARYPLSLELSVKGQAEDEAKKNRRSLNAELGLLIEEGLKWREEQKKQSEV
ncbi:hypothetical protein [Pseudomonas chlororaphis]|uniref:hypothetical protein n=1 Tax=Pseudomonas chlororaphis TaxID=587753 RepID=UPI00160723AA|nr:hypothetical protein [Pseudomonas chlororaphis]WDH25075.1 hypothetical protein PUP50_12640 [Pseudomonas chlororaphis]